MSIETQKAVDEVEIKNCWQSRICQQFFTLKLVILSTGFSKLL